MAGFSTKAYGAAHYSQTTGMLLFSTTEGTGAYALNDQQPGFAVPRLVLRDGQRVRYRASSGIKQEIGNGTFNYARNELSRNLIVLPRDGAVSWDAGRKLIYILDYQ
jgi:hypothetical protein